MDVHVSGLGGETDLGAPLSQAIRGVACRSETMFRSSRAQRLYAPSRTALSRSDSCLCSWIFRRRSSIHSLLPVFLVTVLGAGALSIGFIEGIAEATSQIAKLFSGAVSDWIGRRKLLVLLGYGLSALTKPLFPLASGIGVVVVARFVDRIGKGIRGAPRDALIGDVTPVELRGTAFGLRQSLDTVGAFVGPLLAMLLMAVSSDNFRLVFWIAVVPAIVSVLLILYGVKEPDATPKTESCPFPIQQSELRRLDLAYWWLVGIATVLTLGRFSEAFLLLAAEHVGLAVALIPGVLVAMNVVYAASAYPFGRLSDAVSRLMLLAFGATFLIAADIVLATAGTVGKVFTGVVLWGPIWALPKGCCPRRSLMPRLLICAALHSGYII